MTLKYNLTVKMAATILGALRGENSDVTTILGRTVLALELLGHDQLASMLVHDTSLYTEAKRRLEVMRDAMPKDEPTEGNTFAAFMTPDTPEVAQQRACCDEYRARVDEDGAKIAAIADELEAAIEARAPNYIAQTQEGLLP